MSYGELEAGLVRENNDLQARLAQCEGEKVALAHDRDNWLYRCHSVEDERTELRAERDAALERVREVEAAKEAVYSTLVDERKRLATLEAAVKEAGDAWQVQTNVREGITFRLKMKALLALRAGSVTNGGSAQQIRREVGS